MSHTRGIGIVVCALALSGCFGCADKELVERNEQDALSKNLDENLCVTPLEGIGPVRFGMTKKEVVERFGEPDDVQDSGRSLLYLSRGFSIVVHPQFGVWNISCFTQPAIPPNFRGNDFKGVIGESITMGATEAEIMAVYGTPDTKKTQGQQTQLIYNKLQFHLILLSDQLVQFTIRSLVTRPRKR